MGDSITLLVGLGNPGLTYEKTRHNIGFVFLDKVAEERSTSFHKESRFQGEVARFTHKGTVVHMLKPLTFMNRSGYSVVALSQYFKIGLTQMIVVHDDLDLLPGRICLKRGGGHGGHNGLRDISSSLAETGFLRLRFGIGHPGTRSAVVNYVLSPPPISEQAVLDSAIKKALSVLENILEGQLEKAMNVLHSVSDNSVKEKKG